MTPVDADRQTQWRRAGSFEYVAPLIVVCIRVQRIDYVHIQYIVNTGIPTINMASLRRRNQDSRVLEYAKGKVSESATKTIQDGDVRAAILDLIGTDEDVMTGIVDSVSQVIVSKLLANESFIA